MRNLLGVVHSLFAHAEKRGWCREHPCRRLEFPRLPERDADLRFLDTTELEALLRAVDREDDLVPTDHALHLTVAMTGLRQGWILGHLLTPGSGSSASRPGVGGWAQQS